MPSHSLVWVSSCAQVTPRLCALSKPMPGRRCDHRLVLVGQQALALGHAGEQREVALGDAEGEVGPRRLAPGGDLAAVLPHQRPTAARAHAPGRAGG